MDLKGLRKILLLLKNSRHIDGSPRVILITGTHGVGKSSLMNSIVSKFNWVRGVKASELLNWESKSKVVENIFENQNKLGHIFKEYIKENEDMDIILIDGHLALETTDKKIEFVGEDILRLINPDAILLVERETEDVLQSLKSRGETDYDITRLEKFKKKEREFCMKSTKILGVNCFLINPCQNKI